MSKPSKAHTHSTASTPRLIYRVLLAGGLVLLALGITFIVPGWKSRSWPSTPGTIIGHRLELKNVDKQAPVAVVVRYRYKVGDARYRGENFSNNSKALTPFHSSPEVALGTYHNNSEYSAYQKGKTVTVYYDPGDPENSVLKRGIEPAEIGLLLLGALLLGGALFLRRRLNQPVIVEDASANS